MANKTTAGPGLLRLHTPVLSLGYAMAAAAPGTASIWVHALVKQHMISTQGAGLLASGELALIGISTLTASAFGPRLNPRLVVLGSAIVVALANIIAMAPGIEWIVAGRLLSGLGIGPIYAVVTALGAQGENGQRRFSIMQGSTLALVSTTFFITPNLIGTFGLAGMFGFTALTGALLAALVGFALPIRMPQRKQTTQGKGAGRIRASLLACLGRAIVSLGLSAFTTFLLVVGTRNGVDKASLSHTIALAAPFGIVGPILAHRVGERWGLLRPLQLGLIILATAYFVILQAQTAPVVGAIMVCMAAASAFFVPYAMTMISRADPSGRITGASPAISMAFNAMGPALGGAALGAFGAQGLGAFCAGCTFLAIALFTLAASFGREASGTAEAVA